MTISYNQQPPRFISYWLGYEPKSPSLKETPDCVDVVSLAFALVRPDNTIDTSFLCTSPNTEDSIKDGIRNLRNRGKKVLLSVGGWAGNCWGNVTDTDSLVASIMNVVRSWGLDGVDVDYEGDRPLGDRPACPQPQGGGANLTSLIESLRSKLGDQGILTVVTADGEIWDTMEQLNWVSTMAYGSDYLYKEMAATYHADNKGSFVPFVLGVSCAGDSTHMSLDQVEALCSTRPPAGALSMMLWDLSEDNANTKLYPATGGRSWQYVNAINQNLAVV